MVECDRLLTDEDLKKIKKLKTQKLIKQQEKVETEKEN